MVTPLGKDPREVLRRIEASESAAAPPKRFDASPFACPVCAEVKDFRPQDYVAEPKMIRLMNRDAQLAVAAAHLALQDARLRVGTDYPPEEIALFGATGLAGLPLAEVTALIKNSATPDGRFDDKKFGARGLRSISPLLSFKVLGNMPVCFVSICENIQGPNCIYTPWEGQGAQAIEAGLRAIQCGDARCALVGGCDVKMHELAFISLEQLGLFRSWKETGKGIVPGEGAVFLVLEEEALAAARGARAYARLVDWDLENRRCRSNAGPAAGGLVARLLGRCVPPHPGPLPRGEGESSPSPEQDSRHGLLPTPQTVLPLPKGEGRGEGEGDRRGSLRALVSAADEAFSSRHDEVQTMASAGVAIESVLCPKSQVGNLFAAAAALQVGLGALLAERLGGTVLAHCSGHGSDPAAFLLEPA